ncbi:glycosyltransferase family 4 protein [Novosphingobium sp.]|uniref:glycosyltransferase family 4 protein n=1 Tax=Novosphingobium sp. TaxID=1874826 RepID=UPI00286A6D17|nr:glycosyltransferase family 4 protein [Novosphingobium sp.]
MHILISDYSGHPFQVQLSRELARRGHRVTHMHFAGFQTPKGNLTVRPGDPDTFAIEAITLDTPFAKATFVARWRQENEVGRRIAARIAALRPDVVISSNAPLDTQRHIRRASRKADAKFVFWLQDIYSRAITAVVPKKLPVIGHAIARWYEHLEFALLRGSDRVVAITDDFRPILIAHGVAESRIAVIENWAPLDEIPLMPRENAWAQAYYTGDGMRFLYSGTLGYKHNPHWLLALARRFPDAQVCVTSQGEVADKVAADAAAEGLANLTVRPWVPFADLPALLGGADVMVAFIEPDAGVFSVPSKVLSYLAAGRPVLGAMPRQNLAARLLERQQAGLVSDCGDTADFLAKAARLAGDAALRGTMGENARRYALRAFDIENIGARFQGVIADQAAPKEKRA